GVVAFRRVSEEFSKAGPVRHEPAQTAERWTRRHEAMDRGRDTREVGVGGAPVSSVRRPVALRAEEQPPEGVEKIPTQPDGIQRPAVSLFGGTCGFMYRLR